MLTIFKAAMISILIVYLIGFVAIVKFIYDYVVSGG